MPTTVEVRPEGADLAHSLRNLVRTYGLDAVLAHLADVVHAEAERSQAGSLRSVRFARAEFQLRRFKGSF